MMFKLFPHQEQALKTTEGKNHVAYYLDMGLGKTFVGSEKMLQLGIKINLLICQKSKINDWYEHFKTYYPGIKTFDCTKKGFNYEIDVHLFGYDKKPHVLIINYDLVFRRPQFKKLSNFTLMLDESSIIQNETTKRSKFILEMQPENVILLSGTPTSGKYENLWSQIHLLGWNISKDLYWRQYIETEWAENGDSGFMRKDVVGYKNVDRLKTKLADHGAVFMKTEEVMDLPEQIFTNVLVKTTKEYWKFIKNSLITIDTANLHEFKDDSDFHGKDITPRVELVGDSTLTKRLYSRMLCGHFNQDKLDALKDLIDSTEDRLIIFYNFNEEMQAIKKLAGDRPISIISGPVKDLYNFEKYNDTITLVQYQAGSLGVNLQKANKIIYFTLPQSCEHFMQSKKRIHRIGQDKTCFYYYMICKNSVEEDILEALERGVDYTDELFKTYQEKK